MDDVLDTCIHSMVQRDCVSCLQGEIHRMEKHIERLREMLVAAGGGKALEMHDMHWFGRTWDISDVEMLENDLPGMWSGSDFTGGQTD